MRLDIIRTLLDRLKLFFIPRIFISFPGVNPGFMKKTSNINK